jgi:CRISPR-associated protein Cmr2
VSDSTASIHVRFTPVQDFIAEARRTRDLWAGSYLLSYLAGRALHAAVAAGGTVVSPDIAQNQMYAQVGASLAGRSAPDAAHPRVGTLPNHFEIEAPPEGAVGVATGAVDAWNGAWLGAARAVWSAAIGPWADDVTEVIWARQVGGDGDSAASPWEGHWVVGDYNHLQRRKWLRAFARPAEAGMKCTMCGRREALRTRDSDPRAFWAAVHQRLRAQGRAFDIDADGRERLCAVCAVKRFYPTVRDALPWRIAEQYPSTATIATLPWRRAVLEAVAQGDGELAAALEAYLGALAAANSRMGGLLAFGAAAMFPHLAGLVTQDGPADLLAYDGGLFCPEVVSNPRTELPEGDRPVILDKLEALLEKACRAGIRPPSRFFALVAMDGDRLGQLMHVAGARKAAVSAALQGFADHARDVVEDVTPGAGGPMLGRVVYAGGDDLLALFPVETALGAADRLRRLYSELVGAAVSGTAAGDAAAGGAAEGGARPTISAGLVYAHMHTPLQVVVRRAYAVLNDEAKEAAGRNAFAVEVWKRNGAALSFSRAWDAPGAGGAGYPDLLADLAAQVGDEYTTGFLHHTAEVVATLAPSLDRLTLVAVLTADYMKGRTHEVDAATARERVEALLRLLTMPEGHARRRRDHGGAALEPDPAFFAQFLAQERPWEGGGRKGD